MTTKKILSTVLISAAITVPVAGVASAETGSAGPQVTPVASDAANTAAMESFAATVGVATTAGALIGTGVGAVAGCLIGGVVTAPTVVFVPAGCLAGLVTGAGVGGVVGTLVVGGPTAVIKGVEMVTILLTPA